jgi:hypothetical protein
LVDGANLYLFVRSNPVVLVDPNGEDPTLGPIVKAVEEFMEKVLTRAPARAALPMAGTATTSMAGIGMAVAAGAGIAATGLAIAGTGALTHFRSNSIAQYGTPYGDSARNIAFPLLRGPRYDPPPLPPPPPPSLSKSDPKVDPKPDPKDDPKPDPKPTPGTPPKPKTEDDKNRRRRGEIHHIAGHQNRFSAKFAAIFANANRPKEKDPVGLDSDYNLVVVPGHKGPHGDDYSKVILSRLSKAVGKHTPHTEEYRAALIAELNQLKLDVNTPGNPLYTMVRSTSWGQADDVSKMSPQALDKEVHSIGNPHQYGNTIGIKCINPE